MCTHTQIERQTQTHAQRETRTLRDAFAYREIKQEMHKYLHAFLDRDTKIEGESNTHTHTYLGERRQ